MTESRSPESRAPTRIDALATLPVFHRLRGRDVLLAGSGEGALWKAELLAATGARVRVFVDDDERILSFRLLQRALADRASGDFGSIHIEGRPWQRADIAGCALAIGEFENETDARVFAEAARASGVPVNVIDRPTLCDFQFGAIVNRSPLIVSISTDGAAPVFGQAIRARIETLLPRVLGDWARAALEWRRVVQALKPEFRTRRRFWERFAARAMAARHAPEPGDRDDLLAALETDLVHPVAGSVTLVGAGPGDAELLTIKAVRALQSADVILYDDLVSHEVLELARREAKRMLVGKKGHGPSCKQDDINTLMVKLAQQGRNVVRLKGGDPLIFGRASEEIEACRAAGVAVSVVPGISAAQGAAASLGLSLTERKIARRVQYLTGHGEDGALPADINWAAVADPQVTTVLYMPRHTLADFVSTALANGLDPLTPAAAITNATRADETMLDASIAALPDLLAGQHPHGPTLVMIGAILRHRTRLAAFPDYKKEETALQPVEDKNLFLEPRSKTEAA